MKVCQVNINDKICFCCKRGKRIVDLGWKYVCDTLMSHDSGQSISWPNKKCATVNELWRLRRATSFNYFGNRENASGTNCVTGCESTWQVRRNLRVSVSEATSNKSACSNQICLHTCIIFTGIEALLKQKKQQAVGVDFGFGGNINSDTFSKTWPE